MHFTTAIALLACAAQASTSVQTTTTTTATDGGRNGHLTTISAGDEPITTTIPAHTETFSAKTQIFSVRTHVQKAHNVSVTHNETGQTNKSMETEEVSQLKPTTHTYPQQITRTRPATTKSYPAATVTVQPHHQAVVYSGAEKVAARVGAFVVVAGLAQAIALL